MAVIHEQTSRMMAEYRRERAREDENAQSNQQEVALRKQTTPEPQELTPRQKRNAAFTKANGCRSPQLLDLYARTDSNDDGQLSWDEIRIFQKRLYANYKYQINDPALSPDQFLAEGGGDCEDWALVTVGMLQYWDIKAYIGCFSPPENDKRIAHAIALVPVPEQVDGMFAYNITNSTEWYSGRSIPDGWYVPIDYATVGGITNAMGKDWTLTQVVDGTRMYGERW
jgi:hypothetical protein